MDFFSYTIGYCEKTYLFSQIFTMKIKLPKGITEEWILETVQREYNSVEQKVQEKHQQISENRQLYVNINDQEDKIYERMIFSAHQMFMGMYHQNKPSVSFFMRDVNWADAARNKANLWKFDFEEMGLEQEKFAVQDDKFMTGVGIEVFTGWDNKRKVPIVKVVKPESWYPDMDGDINTGIRWHGFEMIVTRADLRPKNWFFNIDGMKTISQEKLDKLIEQEVQEGYSQKQAENNINEKYPRLINDSQNDNVYSVYYHYTRGTDGTPYIFVLSNDRTNVIKAVEIKAVLEEEKDDPFMIPFPIVVRNWIPLRNDPFGVSLPDLLADKQRAVQLFSYLNKVKAMNEAFGDMFLYDPNVIDDINEMKMPGMGPRYMAADLSQWAGIVEVPKSQVKTDAYNMPEILRSQAERASGMDNAMMGIHPDTVRTQGEHQRIQENANVRMSLGFRVDDWAEKKFVRLWDRFYEEFFSPDDEKNIYLNTGLGKVVYTIKKDDFATIGKLDIVIDSVAKREEERRKDQAAFLPVAWLLLQDAKSEYERNFIKREMLRVSGVNEDKAEYFVPDGIHESRAKMDLELLIRNEELGPITDLSEPHRVYEAIYMSAPDNDAKYKAIEARRSAYMLSGQAKQDAAQQVAAPESTDNFQSQMTSNLIQKTNASNTASLQSAR